MLTPVFLHDTAYVRIDSQSSSLSNSTGLIPEYICGMDFRIAPLLMAVLCLCYLLFIHPSIHPSFPLKQAAKVAQMSIPVVILFILSISVFLRHSFYTKKFKWSFYALQVTNIFLYLWYLIEIQRQNLG